MNNNRIYSFVALVAFIIISPWTSKLFAQVGHVVFMLILLLSCIIFFVNQRMSRNFLYIAITVNIVLLFLTLPQNIDSNIFNVSRVGKDVLIRRFDYYGKDLGILYMNKLGMFYHYNVEPVVHKYGINLFANMDLNAYFFGSHPRELGLDNEFIKFSVLFLPLFIVGFFASLVKKKEVVILFGANLILSALYSANYNSGPVLLYPYFVFFIVYGFRLCLEKSCLLTERH